MPILMEDVEAGLPVDLQVITKNSSILALKSSVFSVVNENQICIHMPIFNGKLLPLETGIKMFVIYNLKQVGRFEFQAEVVGRSSEGNIHYLELSVIGKTTKSQRRNFYRVQHFETLTLYRLSYPFPEEEINKKKKILEERKLKLAEKYKHLKDVIIDEEVEEEYYLSIRVECKDISGGGIRVFSSTPLNDGELLKGEFVLDKERYPFTGRIIRIIETMDPIYPYDIGIAFEGMDEMVRTRLIGYVFRKQRNLMAK